MIGITPRLVELLRENEFARDLARWAVGREERRCPDEGHPWRGAPCELVHGGFTYRDAGVDPTGLARLIPSGLLIDRGKLSSRDPVRTYDLRDVPATRDALELLDAPPAPEERSAEEHPSVPADLWRGVIGLDVEKRKLETCLLADRPVHPLLVGRPASGKSVLVACVERLPGAFTAYGGAVSPAGLRDLFFDSSPPRYLIVDEAEEGKPLHLNRLLSVLEEQRITVLQHGRRETRDLSEIGGVWGIFVCNDDRPLTLKLRSRLFRMELPDLTELGRRAVIAGFLIEREGTEPELAQEIATRVAAKTADVRRARDVARLCKGDRSRLDEIVAWLDGG